MNSLFRLLAAVVAGVFLLNTAAAAEFRLNLARTPAESALTVSGENDQEYLLESATGLNPDGWNVLGSFVMTNDARLWRQTGAEGSRFFRARSIDPVESQFAQNFRLIDQDGKARELFYYRSLTTTKAIVLIFAQSNYPAFAAKIAALKAKAIFQNSVMFWTIETGAENSRTNIQREATAAAITWPVYHDPQQFVAHDFDAHFNGEVFAISRPDMRVVYRGVIDDGTNAYLAASLSDIVAGETIITTRLEPSQKSRVARPVRTLADYSTVIGPLLQRKCASCHSPDNIAPFALTNHAAVVEHAALMKNEIMVHNMPPWHADPEYGKFKNDNSLNPQEFAQLVDWLDAGCPRGTGADDPLTVLPPPPSKWPADLGEPDQIVTIPPQSIIASGTEPYRYIFANATNATEKWLRAAVVRPSNRRVVHHYIVWNGHSTSAQLTGIATYVPGRTNVAYPAGTGVRLAANAPVTFNLHYTADGQPEEDQPELGLWYAASTPAHEMQLGAPLQLLLTIPAGNPDYSVTGLTTQSFTVPSRIYSMSPHMHMRGLRMKFELTQPGVAGKKTILSVPQYHFDWQTIYYLDPPLDVPAGSVISISGGFDNSAQNRYNPDPKLAVNWGEQSWNEMFIGYIEYSDR